MPIKLCQILFFFIVSWAFCQTDSLKLTDNVVKEFDSYLRMGNSFTALCIVKTGVPNNPENLVTYRLLMKSSSKSLLFTLSPARDYGKIYLQIDNKIWCYFPKAGKPIVISTNNSLSGMVNVGDLLRPGLTKLYNLSSKNDSGDSTIFVFERKNREAPFAKTKYKLFKDKVIEAFAYSATDICLRHLLFSQFVSNPDGHKVAACVRIENPVDTRYYAEVKMSEINFKSSFPDYWFNPSNLFKVNINK